MWHSGKKSTCWYRRHELNPGSGRSSGEGNGNPLQYSCLENSMDRGPWWATVLRVAKSWTRLNTTTRICMMSLYCPLLCGVLTHGTHYYHLDKMVDKNKRSLKKSIHRCQSSWDRNTYKILLRGVIIQKYKCAFHRDCTICNTSRNVHKLVKISVLNIKHRYEASQDNGFSALTLQCSEKSYFYRRQHATGNRIDKDDICLLVVRLYPVSN